MCGVVPACSEYVAGLMLHFTNFSLLNLFIVPEKLYVKCTVNLFIL